MTQIFFSFFFFFFLFFVLTMEERGLVAGIRKDRTLKLPMFKRYRDLVVSLPCSHWVSDADLEVDRCPRGRE